MKLLLATLLFSLNAFAQDVYFARSSFEGPAHPFCVSWANAALPESSASSAHNKTSYACQINFTYRLRTGDYDFSSDEHHGSHSVSFRAVGKNRARSEVLRSELRTGLGYVLRTDKNGGATIDIMGEQFETLFPSAQLLSDSLTFDLREGMLHLKPKFNAANAGRELACQVVALELLALACDDSRDALSEDIQNRLRSVFYWQNMRRGLIPRTQGQNP